MSGVGGGGGGPRDGGQHGEATPDGAQRPQGEAKSGGAHRPQGAGASGDGAGHGLPQGPPQGGVNPGSAHRPHGGDPRGGGPQGDVNPGGLHRLQGGVQGNRNVTQRGWIHGLGDRGLRNLCILPVLTLLILFNIFPLLASLGVSFADFNPILDDAPRFTGFGNYTGLLNGPRQEVWQSFVRTGALVLATVGLETLVGFGVALLLRRRFQGRGLFTAILLIPMMLSPAVMGSFWRYLFNADYGVINWFLDVRWGWDGNQARAFLAVVIAEVWMWTPFMMLLSLAGLSSIPETLYEAAEVDRAGAWFRFRHITLPLAAPMVLLGVVFRAMDTFRLFDAAMVLNGNLEGQPTTFVSVLLHARGFGGSRSLGEPTALAYLLLIASLALTTLVLRYLDHVKGARL